MRHHQLYSNIIGLLILQTIALGQLQFSGFADILLISPFDEQMNAEIQSGQFELGLSASIQPGISFEGAIAYNSETGTFEAGAGFIELVFAGEQGVHSAHGNYVNHLGLSIGQFDVPFGIDWQHIASPDRQLITAPLTNEKSINAWNDIGLNFHADFGNTRLTSFLVNGAENGYAIGGRAAYTPLDGFEIGTSYLTQTLSNNSGSKPQVLGADIQTITGPLATRMELQYSQDLLNGEFSEIDSIDTHRGFYLQADLDLSAITNIPLVLIGRYDDWSTVNNLEDATRTTIGVAYTVSEGLQFRAEYLYDIVNGEQENQQLAIQTVVSF